MVDEVHYIIKLIYNLQILRDQLASNVFFILPRCEVNHAGGICHFPRRDLDLSASAIALLAGCGRDGFAIIVMHRALAVSAARGSQRRSVEACHRPALPSPASYPPQPSPTFGAAAQREKA